MHAACATLVNINTDTTALKKSILLAQPDELIKSEKCKTNIREQYEKKVSFKIFSWSTDFLQCVQFIPKHGNWKACAMSLSTSEHGTPHTLLLYSHILSYVPMIYN